MPTNRCLPPNCDVGHAAIHRKYGAILAAAFHLAPAAGLHHLAGLQMIGEVAIMVRAAELGHEYIDATARHLIWPVSEYRGRSGIDGDDRSPLVDGDDTVGHPVEHGVEPSLALAKRRRAALGFGAFKRRGVGLRMHAMQRLGQENRGCACGNERKRASQICRALNRSGPDADRQYGQGGGEQASRQAPKQRGQEHSREKDEECQRRVPSRPGKARPWPRPRQWRQRRSKAERRRDVRAKAAGPAEAAARAARRSAPPVRSGASQETAKAASYEP